MARVTLEDPLLDLPMAGVGGPLSLHRIPNLIVSGVELDAENLTGHEPSLSCKVPEDTCTPARGERAGFLRCGGWDRRCQ